MALATAYTWLRITHRHTLTVGSVVACTVIAVTSSLLLEQAIKQVRRRGRPRRTHALGRCQARVHDLQTGTSTPQSRKDITPA
jgi:hypothetical protein